MNDELAGLREEKDRLQLRRDNAQLRSELAALEVPWWRRVGVVTGLTATLGATIPATTAVHGYFQKERELALQESKQQEDTYVRYLDRLKDSTERARTLRFVAATSVDKRFRAWAEEEKKAVDAEVAELKREIEDQKKRLDAAESALSDARNESEASRAAYRRQAASAAAKLASLQSQLSEASRTALTPPVVPGWSPRVQTPKPTTAECAQYRKCVEKCFDPGIPIPSHSCFVQCAVDAWPTALRNEYDDDIARETIMQCNTTGGAASH
jgi:hypothetical protein